MSTIFPHCFEGKNYMWQHYTVWACDTDLALHNANYHTYLSVLYRVRRSSLIQGCRANGGGGGRGGGEYTEWILDVWLNGTNRTMTNLKSMKMRINLQSKYTDLFPITYEIPIIIIIIIIQIASSKSFKKHCSLFSIPYKDKNPLNDWRPVSLHKA